MTPDTVAPSARPAVAPPDSAARPVRAEILAVAAPVAFGAVAGVGGQFAVGALLGHLHGDALYVRGLLIPIGFLFVALQEGLEVVTQVGTARYLGGGRHASLRGLFVRLTLAGLASFAVVAALLAVAAPGLADLVRVPHRALGDFEGVLRWTALVNVVGVPVNVATAMLRGGGRARHGATVTTAVTVVQIAAVWLLGTRGGLGVYALPWAAAAAVACGATVSVTLLLRSGLLRPAGGGAVDGPSPADPAGRADGPPVDLRSLLTGIGLPVAATYVLLSAMNLVTEWLLAPFGPSVVAGYGAAVLVQSVAVVPALALGTATAVTANHRWAGGEVRALPEALGAGVRIAAVAYAGIAALCLAAAGPLARLMIADPASAAETAAFLRIVGPGFLTLGVMLFLLTFLEQIGAGLIAATVNLCYFTLTLAVGGTLARTLHRPHLLYVAWAGGSLLCLLAVAPLTRRRLRRTAPAGAVGATGATGAGDPEGAAAGIGAGA